MRARAFLIVGSLAAGVLLPTAASADRPDPHFVRVGNFSVYTNNDDPSAETVAEILDATEDGMGVVYADAETGAIGFVDISDPTSPQPDGTVAVDGSPTGLAVAGEHVLVGVDTSDSYVEPSGHLAVVDVDSRSVLATLDLGGQPDSVAVSPDGRYAAVAIENERDEDVVVDGVEGGLPQGPAGLLQIVDLVGDPQGWVVRDVDLTGLASYGTDDPEPEYVDINQANHAVVTLQENNHVVVVDLPTGRIRSDFDAGTVDLDRVDTVEDDVISLTGSLSDVPREPDAVGWLDGNRFATANEGDLFGGSRGFTIFDERGHVVHDSGASFEHEIVRAGHYPESRSENKGAEPEGIEVGRFGAATYLFVGAERANVVGVYEISGSSAPTFVQLLPTGLGPEGITAIPSRDLLVVTSEKDDPTYGVRTSVTIYELQDGPRAYPEIVSADDDAGTPIPWSALSGMVADPTDPTTVYAVSDSYYANARIFTLDVSTVPATITAATTVTGASSDLDLEGITIAPDGTWWLASEGNASGSRPNLVLQVAPDGTVLVEHGLPDVIEACRSASTATATLGSGFEGITPLPTDGGGFVLAVAQQRGWDYTSADCEDLDDDASGLDANGQPASTRVWLLDPTDGTWDHVAYELAEVPTNAKWVGLSEVTHLSDGEVMLIERDNRTGDWAELKTLVRADLDGDITAEDKDVVDLLPAMRATDGWISDKPEGVAVTADGQVLVVTDNDGVDDWSGETQLLRLGSLDGLFAR